MTTTASSFGTPAAGRRVGLCFELSSGGARSRVVVVQGAAAGGRRVLYLAGPGQVTPVVQGVAAGGRNALLGAPTTYGCRAAAAAGDGQAPATNGDDDEQPAAEKIRVTAHKCVDLLKVMLDRCPEVITLKELNFVVGYFAVVYIIYGPPADSVKDAIDALNVMATVYLEPGSPAATDGLKRIADNSVLRQLLAEGPCPCSDPEPADAAHGAEFDNVFTQVKNKLVAKFDIPPEDAPW